MAKRPNIGAASEEVQRKILCFLHFRYAHSENIVFTEKELSEYIKDTGARIIHYSLEELGQTAYVDSEIVVEDKEKVHAYSITREGIKFVERWSDDDYDQISKGIDFLEPDDGQQEKRSDIEPEDRWQPLPLERSGSKYENAVASTEAALKEIEGNNGYAESAPEERDRIVWSISEGLKHIKEGFPSRDQVISMLLKPLRYIAEKFSAASMGEAAKAAVKALLSWLALS